MADDNDTDDEEEEGGGKKKIIMIVGGLAALGAVYNFVLKAPPPEDPEAIAAAEAAAAMVEPVEGEIVELDEMILNIGGESPGYLRVGLAIVLDEETLAADFEAESAIAKDVAVQYLSAQTSETLRSAEGRQMAKEELSMLMREAYGDAQVVRVLFTALVMQ